jgi:putative ABC transport system permease protein
MRARFGWSRRWYRLLVRLAVPRAFQTRFADDMVEDFAELTSQSVASRGALGRLLAWRRALADLIRTAWRERHRHPPIGSEPQERRPMRDRWLTDLRHAVRGLAIRRGASMAVVGVFGLGVGVMSAMFALTDPYLLRSLPYTQPGELAVIEVDADGLTAGVVVPTVADWRARTDLFRALAAFESGQRRRLALANGAVLFQIRMVTSDFFDVLGIAAPRSSAWAPAPSDVETPVLLMPGVIGALSAEERQSGHLLNAHEGTPLRVAGALPDTFRFPDTGVRELRGLTPYVPGAVIKYVVVRRGRAFLDSRPTIIARLQPGVTPAIVQSALAMPLPSGQRLAVRAEWLRESLTRATRPLALGTMAAGMLMLLVCAGNVANLLVARGAFRTQEFATREALGGTRADIVRLQLLELGVLTVTSVAVGLAVTWTALAVTAGVVPDKYTELGAPVINLRTGAFAVIVGLVIVVLGVFPAVLVSRLAGQTPFGTRVAPAGRAVRAIRVAFAAAQSAIAMVLVVGAAMLLQSYANLMRQNTGYDEQAISVAVRHTARPGGVPVFEAVEATSERLGRIPGVGLVGAAEDPIVGRGMSQSSMRVNGAVVMVETTNVTPGLVAAAGIQLLRGRTLVPDDARERVLVNEAFARQHWPGVSPLDQIVLRSGGTAPNPIQASIVGVVRNVFDQRLDTAPGPRMYVLMEPSAKADRMHYVIRPSGRVPVSYDDIRRAVLAATPDAIVESIGPIGDRLAETVRERTFATFVLSFFGVAGAAVTVAGLIGIVSFVVARRTREIAIRIAIGAGTGHVSQLVTREALTAAAAGGAAGLLAGRWLSTWLGHLVYGIEAGNWTTTMGAGVVLLAIMVVAALATARRALKLPTTIALRAE